MRTSNPVLSDAAFEQVQSYGSGASMTIQGTVNKTFGLFFLLMITAFWVWGKVMQPQSAVQEFEQQGMAVDPMIGPIMMVGILGGMIVAFITVFKKEWAGFTAPAYALLEGLALGGISAYFELMYPGLVVQAIALTFGTLFCLLLAYKTGFVRVTDKFRAGVVAATGAIALIYLVNFVMSFFKTAIPIIASTSGFGIAFSLIVVGVAALNLVLDFDFIEKASSRGAPKYMEWYGAFGLMVTLVWLYLEMLRLLAKLRDRR